MLSACGLIYEQDVQQGNVLEQEQIDLLSPGMTRRQVQLVMGTPAVTDPFHRSRWDYVAYTIPEGEGMQKLRQISLFFEGNQLVRIEGDLKPTDADILGAEDIEAQVDEVRENGEETEIGLRPMIQEQTDPDVDEPVPTP